MNSKPLRNLNPQLRKLNEFEAQQFALLLFAGVPPAAVATSLLPPDATETEVETAAQEWPRQRVVLTAIEKLSGGQWQDLRKEERLQLAIEKHYAEMAYFLWTHNYADLQGPDRSKADTCRAALEAKLAGTAGKGNALERLYEEIVQRNRQAVLPKIGMA